jgi:hypothetical protein
MTQGISGFRAGQRIPHPVPIKAIPTGDANGLGALVTAGPFGIPEWDSVALAYTGANLTGVTYSYKGEEVGVLALTYNGSGYLTGVTRTA